MMNNICCLVLSKEGLQCEFLLNELVILNNIIMSPDSLRKKRKERIFLFCWRLESQLGDCLQNVIPKVDLSREVFILDLIVVNGSEGCLRCEYH